MTFNLGTQDGQRLRQPLAKFFLRHAARRGGSPQDAYIGVAVQRKTVDLALAIPRLAQGAMESVVMYRVAAVEQRAVDIEQIGVESVPRQACYQGLPRSCPQGLLHTL